MSAARQRAFNPRPASSSRKGAIAAVMVNFKKISPDGDREERLAWISEYLGREVASITDLTDAQLGAVAGEMKRLVGGVSGVPESRSSAANIVQGNFDRESPTSQVRNSATSQTIHLASPEQIHTMEKLREHLRWAPKDVFEFIRKRVLTGKAKLANSVPNFHMLTFRQATTATNALLHVAAHADLKKRTGGKPVSRIEINKYIPHLKTELRIDQKPR